MPPVISQKLCSAAIFVPLFVIIELVREKPFVNLRLLACHNLASRGITELNKTPDAVTDYAGDQLRFANIVRAFGQPFTIVPITGLAVATLAAKDAGSGSAIFNIFRNIGGSVGIAILSTLVTRREQFHDLRIGELVTVYSPATQARLAELQGNFVNKGFDTTMALKQAYAVIKSLVSREAFVMAFNDAFLVITIALVFCAAAIWFCKKPSSEEAHAPAG